MPDLNTSATEFNLATLSPVPLCGVNSCTGMPIRLNSWNSGVPLDFFSTTNESGSHSLYSRMHKSFNSGNSTRTLIAFSSIKCAAPWVNSSSSNTPHVNRAEKSARLFCSAAASSVMMMYSQSGGSSLSHSFHHSRLTMAPSSDVGFCWYCAFHWYAGIDARVRCRAFKS